MIASDLIEEIKIDLGCDINSLGISDSSILSKVKEALRKVSIYAPYVCVETLRVSNGKIELPDDTTCVIGIKNYDKSSATRAKMIADDTDLFSVSRYLYNYNDLMDPYQFLMQKTAVTTLQSFVRLDDHYYDKKSHTLYISNHDGSDLTVHYLREYRSVEEITDTDVLQTVKEYALALCKIVEGNIRRKLQSAPGAIQMDGDNLVSEGISEKQYIESSLASRFQNIRFGIRV